MHIHRLSSTLILLLTTLPRSLTAPPVNSVSAGPLAVQCFPRPEGGRCISPFPSNCRTLAANIRNRPNAMTPMIFDSRWQDPTQPHIPVVFSAFFQTCKARFIPYRLDPSSTPGSNFATYAGFAVAIEEMIDECFTYGPGEESKDYAVAIATFDAVIPSGTIKWKGGITGPDRPLQAGSANETADDEGLDCTDIVESWASMNGSTNGLGIGGSGTAEQGRVDVT